MRKVTENKNSIAKRILCLGYDENQTYIISKLSELGHEVWHCNERLEEPSHFDLVISFGYKHVLKGELLSRMQCPVINLHISYLPFNRGAHPNFWSFFDKTPSGVTIHLVDEGIDTGDILYQRRVIFSEDENTFSLTYARLINEIELLFIENIKSIVGAFYQNLPQPEGGTYHQMADLPSVFKGWDSVIEDEIKRLHTILKA